MNKNRTRDLQEVNARVLLAASAICAIQQTQAMLVESGADEQMTSAIATRIAAPYWTRLQELTCGSDDPDELRIQKEVQDALTVAAAHAEQAAILRLREIRAIDPLTERRLSRELARGSIPPAGKESDDTKNR